MAVVLAALACLRATGIAARAVSAWSPGGAASGKLALSGRAGVAIATVELDLGPHRARRRVQTPSVKDPSYSTGEGGISDAGLQNAMSMGRTPLAWAHVLV
jgi:hypothetical protein